MRGTGPMASRDRRRASTSPIGSRNGVPFPAEIQTSCAPDRRASWFRPHGADRGFHPHTVEVRAEGDLVRRERRARPGACRDADAARAGLPSRLPAPLIPAKMIDAAMVNGPWKRLVFRHPAHQGGTVNRHALRALRAGLTRSQRPGAGIETRLTPRALAIVAGLSPRARRALAAASLSASITVGRPPVRP